MTPDATDAHSGTDGSGDREAKFMLPYFRNAATEFLSRTTAVQFKGTHRYVFFFFLTTTRIFTTTPVSVSVSTVSHSRPQHPALRHDDVSNEYKLALN